MASRSVSGNSSISIVLEAGKTVTAGNSIVVAVSVGTFAGAVGCTDTKGNTYTVVNDVKGPGRLFVCSARDVVTLSAGDKITATYPGFSGSTVASASEFSGVTSVTGHESATGSGLTPTASLTGQPGSLIQTDFLIVGAVAYTATPTFAADCADGPAEHVFRSMTAVGPVSAGGGSGKKTLVLMYRIATDPGSYSTCGTLSGSRPWLAAVTSSH
jgi:hypothetical protein